MRFTRGLRERGAALVEMAIVAPLLIMILMGIIDFGDAWFRSASAQSGLRSASVVGFDAGDSYNHDLRVLRRTVAELANRKIENIEFIAIYDADTYDDLPPGCSGAAGVTGISGRCVVYGGDYLSTVLSEAVESDFVSDCSSSIDRLWCAQNRGVGKDKWSVGIYVKAKQDTLTGFIPGFSTYDIEKKTVIRERSRGSA